MRRHFSNPAMCPHKRIFVPSILVTLVRLFHTVCCVCVYVCVKADVCAWSRHGWVISGMRYVRIRRNGSSCVTKGLRRYVCLVKRMYAQQTTSFKQ